MPASSSPQLPETKPAPSRTRRLILRLIAAAALLVVVLAAVVGGGIWWGLKEYKKPGPLAASKIVVIPKGAGLADIAQRLAEAGVIERPIVFRAVARAEEKAHLLKAGEYEFPAAVSQEAVVRLLIEGKTVVHKVTVAEGLTTAEILQVIARTDALDGTITEKPGEGALLPETYNFSRGDGRDALVERMTKAMTETLDQLWAKRAPNLPLRSKTEALILASIVEKETGVASERPRVAAVFINRIRRGMRLDSDPTVIYGLTQGQGPLNRPLLTKDLEAKTPYNTYQIDGLPPGPIANPGRAALEATLHPAETKDLFFVADGSGGHVFSETLGEHNRNVQRWRTLQRERRNAVDGKAPDAKK
ncbi:MAG: endolytic transglycosylase MltG [Candidatus Eiseniibacteriota bacterium]